MTTAITIFVLIVVLAGAFVFGVYVGGYFGVHRTGEVLEAALDNSDITDLQRLQIVSKMREAIKSKKQ